MEILKHECGVAMIRLLKPIDYYIQKYGTAQYALNLLYLLMEKQHNRGQEGAGVGVVKMHTSPGNEYMFRERALGTNAISEIFDSIYNQIGSLDNLSTEHIKSLTPFIGEIYMGHLRYSTTGKSGMSYVHPFLRRSNWRSQNLLLCGNFNLTNVPEVFHSIVMKGQHPRFYSDTYMLLEQLGFCLDKENHRLYEQVKNDTTPANITQIIEDRLDVSKILSEAAPMWDGGFVICGATGSGDMFALRDSSGIRPAFYYYDDEIVVLASERPVIQTVLNVRRKNVQELTPGAALIVSKSGRVSIKQILPEKSNNRCSFERIYFSRGSDADIYQERKLLGRNLVSRLMQSINNDLETAVLSFIPNTAEVAFIGMVEGFEKVLNKRKAEQILNLSKTGKLTSDSVIEIMNQKLRVEKVAIKDIKLRTFIAEGTTRNDLAAHVYDVTYGCVVNNVSTLVVIDDSIVRGTTLKQSILRMLGRLHPKKIVIVSSAPQVRYPDYYGIDMSRLSEFIAFRAVIELLKERGEQSRLKEVYDECIRQSFLKPQEQINCVKRIYEGFTDEDISKQIAKMLTPDDCEAEIEIVYQTLEGLHNAIPNHPGDWYFSGDYPTPGGNRLVNLAYINYFEGNHDKR
ncbi:MAG: amidophosphoribosyltransferase [Muribaculaceae bacterium]